MMIINQPQQWAVCDLRHHRHPRRHGRGRCPGKKGFQVIIWWSFGSYGEYGDHGEYGEYGDHLDHITNKGGDADDD